MEVEITIFTRDMVCLGSTVVPVHAHGGRLYVRSNAKIDVDISISDTALDGRTF